jgi:hypothetical protein
MRRKDVYGVHDAMRCGAVAISRVGLISLGMDHGLPLSTRVVIFTWKFYP